MCPQSLPTVLSSFQNLLHLICVWKEGRGRIWWQFQLERVKKLLVGTNIKARTWKSNLKTVYRTLIMFYKIPLVLMQINF